MNKTYALQRPNSAPEINPKRQRRKTRMVFYKETSENNIFSYSCFSCSYPIKIEGNDDIEIECANCSSRIIRKNKTNKDRVVEAI